MPLKVLIIGYGSIGARHAEVLQTYFNATCTLISSKPLPKAYPSLNALKDIKAFDYYIIASPTHTHLRYLRTLDSMLEHKIIFIEKPLCAASFHDTDFAPLMANPNQGKNTIVVGFCLRFHPLLWRLKETLHNLDSAHKPYFAQISCGSYLPLWREGVDYRAVYSAQERMGGGVLLDLSHELDYAQWLFGEFKQIAGFNGKISELEITSDDSLNLIATTAQGTLINLSVDYFSKQPRRLVRVHTSAYEYELDLVQNTLTTTDTYAKSHLDSITFTRNELFATMHQSVLHHAGFLQTKLPKPLASLAKKRDILPNLTESVRLMHTISRIKNMKLQQNILCVIGARGGSKGVKNKNITPLAGKPLIAHTILQALQSRLFEHIVLTTDSKEIARVGQEWGAEVFFLREAALATDEAGKLGAIRDALLRSEAHYNTRFDVVFDLDATSPLRLVSDITEAYAQFVRDNNDILITAAPARKNPYFNLVEIFEEGDMSRVGLSKRPSKPILRRQDAPKCYDMNASIYIWKRAALLEHESVFTPNTGLFIMPEERSIDIDAPLDFAFVEFMLTRANNPIFNGGGG